MQVIPRLVPATSVRMRLLIGLWLLSLVLVIITLTTPLEFSPLPLGNIPRWLVWGLAFPVGRWVARRGNWFRWVGYAIPGLLWGSVIGVELLVAWDVYQRPASEYHTHTWRKAVRPLEMVFFNRLHWLPPDVLFRRSNKVVAHQLLLDPRYGARFRYAILSPVLPGLQWAKQIPIPEDAEKLLDVSWQLVDTVSVGMSQDTGLQRRVRPWVVGQRYNQQARINDAWRERRGLPRSNTPELPVPATQYGANTLSCMVTATGSATENSFWASPRVRQGHDSYAVYRDLASTEYGPVQQLTIDTNLLFNGIEYPLNIKLVSLRGCGTYSLVEKSSEGTPLNQLVFVDAINGREYFPHPSFPATVTITQLDTLRGIVSGRFSGMLRNGTEGDYSVIIENGCFDFLYQCRQSRE
ncbi:MAG: hypothetical protein M3Y54_07345 [Bacteroidota bacterium]|nr:hypothetical protein [Bacteroidota bacterium]